MANSYPSTRIHAKDAKGEAKRWDGLRRPAQDDIRFTIPDREQRLDKREHCANIAVVILLTAIVAAFITLFLHVASK